MLKMGTLLLAPAILFGSFLPACAQGGPYTFQDPSRDVYCQLSDLTLTLDPYPTGGGQARLTFVQNCTSRRSDKTGPWRFDVPVYYGTALVRTFQFYYSHQCGEHYAQLVADWPRGAPMNVVNSARLVWNRPSRVHGC
jgi:hypothetical protein